MPFLEIMTSVIHFSEKNLPEVQGRIKDIFLMSKPLSKRQEALQLLYGITGPLLVLTVCHMTLTEPVKGAVFLLMFPT